MRRSPFCTDGVPSQIANGTATYNFVMNRNVTFKSSSNFTVPWRCSCCCGSELHVQHAADRWMPGATGLSPYVVKFIAMACQFGWIPDAGDNGRYQERERAVELYFTT